MPSIKTLAAAAGLALISTAAASGAEAGAATPSAPDLQQQAETRIAPPLLAPSLIVEAKFKHRKFRSHQGFRGRHRGRRGYDHRRFRSNRFGHGHGHNRGHGRRSFGKGFFGFPFFLGKGVVIIK